MKNKLIAAALSSILLGGVAFSEQAGVQESGAVVTLSKGFAMSDGCIIKFETDGEDVPEVLGSFIGCLSGKGKSVGELELEFKNLGEQAGYQFIESNNVWFAESADPDQICAPTLYGQLADHQGNAVFRSSVSLGDVGGYQIAYDLLNSEEPGCEIAE